jgi:D-galacturonate reductase
MLDVLVIGGGMIVYDQILPSLFHLQRLQRLGQISIAATSISRLQHLRDDHFRQAFPGQQFVSYPSLDSSKLGSSNPEYWRTALAGLRRFQLVIIATPDAHHREMVEAALDSNQHVLCVKPLVYQQEQSRKIAETARKRGLLVAVEYHKRFDRRALEARWRYRQGQFGEFACGMARMIEPYAYRHSNFQNWFLKEWTDPFVYVGCHYVDLVFFITGLRPVDISVRGVERPFANGNRAFMWANGRLSYENGALLSVSAGLGYPDLGSGPNDQGMTLYCEGDNCGGLVDHNDQQRGVGHCYVTSQSGVHFRHVNPDYFRLVEWDGEGLKPVGYGYDSIEATVSVVHQLREENAPRSEQEACEHRQAILAHVDQHELLATAANSSVNDAVIEAARHSIQNDGMTVTI